MDKYSFSWNTSADTGVSFKSWEAEYDEKSGSISVSWKQDKANRVVVYYRLNNGVIEPLTTTDKNEITILNVGVPDVSGVRGGRQLTGIREYKFFIELYSEAVMESRASFKIWNMPGMAVSDTNPVVEIRTAEELAAIKDNLGGQYVLANDISVTGAWTPIGTEASPFTGKLYGNGRTITFTGGGSIGGAANHRGLFGYAQGSASRSAVIRDFTFEYNASGTINASGGNSDFCIGGVVGYLKNGVASNIITSGGTIGVNVAGDAAVSLGGIAGIVDGSFISNCRAGLNVKLTRSGGVGNVGAVAGFTKDGSGGSIKININSPGKTANNRDVNRLAVDGVTVTADVTGNTSGGALCIGGAAGDSSGGTMRDIIVSGQVSFNRTAITGSTCVGGVTGYAENSNMEACSFAGNAVGTIDDLNDVYLRMGGLIGSYDTDDGEVYINNCLVRGNIRIDEKDHSGIKNGSGINIGGVLGVSNYTNGKVNITNSFFEEGNITAVCYSGSNQAGGFCGAFYEGGDEQTESSHYLNNCGVLAGTVTVEVKNYGRYITVGGFTSTIWLKGNTSNCFSRANVISKGKGNNNEEGGDPFTYTHQAGGFAGGLASGSTLASCYATGNVSLEHSGERQLSVGGLVGNSGGIIENCYALGNVSAEKIGENDGVVYAGGLVGMVYKTSSESDYDGIIRYSFSAGKIITAKTNQNSAYVGGAVGAIWPNDDAHSKINNTAALGEKVSASGDGWLYVGEISGNDSDDVDYVDNYAIDTMTTEGGNEDSPGNSGEDSSPKITDFMSASWWQKTLKFDPLVWDFSTPAVYRGYPLLKGLAGQE